MRSFHTTSSTTMLPPPELEEELELVDEEPEEPLLEDDVLLVPLLDEELELDELDVLLALLLDEELVLDELLELDEDELELLLLLDEELELDGLDVPELPDDPDGLLESSGPGEPELSLQAITEEIRTPTSRMRANFTKRLISFAAGKDPCLITTPVHGTTTQIQGRRLLRFK